MRPWILLLFIATLFGSVFWYEKMDVPCDTPLYYYIGTVDERFGTDVEEIKTIALHAEQLWEKNLNSELFQYDESKEGTPLNLIFDERQENADMEQELREDLEIKEGMSDEIARQYEKLIVEFRTLRKEYEARVVAYETSLREYNREVTKWNDKGGAPETIISNLRSTERELKNEQSALQKLAEQINTIVDGLNRIGARGNVLITDYNTIVEKYNDEFSEAREFAQGDYTGEAINVYQFDSEEELTLVFAHEFGHALGFEHVENDVSIMHYLMGPQSIESGLSAEDIAEYSRVCKEKPFFYKALDLITDLLLSR